MSRRLTQLNEVPHQNNLSDTDFQSGPAQQSSPPDKLRLPPGTNPHVSTKALWVQPGVTRGPTSRSPIGCALTGFMLQRAKWTTQRACPSRAGENPHPQSHARALRRHVRLIPAQGLWLSRTPSPTWSVFVPLQTWSDSDLPAVEVCQWLPDVDATLISIVLPFMQSHLNNIHYY